MCGVTDTVESVWTCAPCVPVLRYGTSVRPFVPRLRLTVSMPATLEGKQGFASDILGWEQLRQRH